MPMVKIAIVAYLLDTLCNSATCAFHQCLQPRLLALLQCCVERLQLCLVPEQERQLRTRLPMQDPACIACSAHEQEGNPSRRTRGSSNCYQESQHARPPFYMCCHAHLRTLSNSVPISLCFEVAMWRVDAPFLELAPCHFVAVCDEVVLLREGVPLNDKFSGNLIALERSVPRHIVDLCAYPGPQLCFVHCAIRLCMQCAKTSQWPARHLD